MTESWHRFTNKMLYHAQIQLDAWENSEEPMAGAFREACIRNMLMTYQSLLAEILSVYQVPVNSLPDLSDALALLRQKNEVSSELTYIQQLEKKHSWLMALQRANRETVCLSSFAAPVHQQHELTLKPLEVTPMSSISEVSNGMNALRELIIYSRNYSLEW